MPTAVDALVLDASAFVQAFTRSTAGTSAVRARIDVATVHAPHLLIAEVGSVARRMVMTGAIPAKRGFAIVDGAVEAIDRVHPHGSLARLAWTLRDNISFYDALYVALATTLGYPLLTADARLANAPGLPCAVELVD